jgi:hypothetical protein
MLNLFQHPGQSRLAGGGLDLKQVQGDGGARSQRGAGSGMGDDHQRSGPLQAAVEA